MIAGVTNLPVEFVKIVSLRDYIYILKKKYKIKESTISGALEKEVDKMWKSEKMDKTVKDRLNGMIKNLPDNDLPK